MGSVLLVVLLTCLGAMALCAGLAVLVQGGESLLIQERDAAAESVAADTRLFRMAGSARRQWGARVEEFGPGRPGELEWNEADRPGTLRAWVPMWPDRRLGTRVERAQDGIDLPYAAVVADRLVWPDSRTVAAISSPRGTGTVAPVVTRVSPPAAMLGPDVASSVLPKRWSLDEGSLFQIREEMAHGSHASVLLLERDGLGYVEYADTLWSPAGDPSPGGNDAAGSAPETPALIVVTGGASLSVSSLGDMFAVIVVDGGSLRLEGTLLHGAVFCSEQVHMGASGGVVFEPAILRWDTDRSHGRVRLVPGTRTESDVG